MLNGHDDTIQDNLIQYELHSDCHKKTFMSSLQTLLLTAIDYVVSNRPQKNGNTPQINTTKCFHEVAIWVILITKIYFGGFFVHERKKKQSKVCQTHTEA